MPEVVYHYTSHEAAQSIITNEQLWLTNLRYLNDRNEFLWTHRQLEAYQAKRVSAGDPVVASLSSKIAAQSWSEQHTISICVACFSQKPDDAGQWERYASKGKGVAVGVAASGLTASIRALHGDAMPIQYGEELCQQQLDHALRKIENAETSGTPIFGSMQDPFPRVAAFSKDASFSSEEEYRLALWGVDYMSYKFRSRDDSLIPYTVLPISREHILDIKLGPKSSQESQSAWTLLLNQLYDGRPPDRVKISKSTSGLR